MNKEARTIANILVWCSSQNFCGCSLVIVIVASRAIPMFAFRRFYKIVTYTCICSYGWTLGRGGCNSSEFLSLTRCCCIQSGSKSVFVGSHTHPWVELKGLKVSEMGMVVGQHWQGKL